MRISELILSEAAATKYVFINPKNKGKEYSGEYMIIAATDITPSEKYLKKLKAGIYSHSELVKKSGVPNSSHLVDQLPHEYNLPELSTGQIVTVNNSGELEFKPHMKSKIKLDKKFTDWMIKNGYLVVDTED